jgi:hypothetical protein
MSYFAERYLDFVHYIPLRKGRDRTDESCLPVPQSHWWQSRQQPCPCPLNNPEGEERIDVEFISSGPYYEKFLSICSCGFDVTGGGQICGVKYNSGGRG